MNNCIAFRQLEKEELLEVDGGGPAVGSIAQGIAALCGFGAIIAGGLGYTDLAGGLAGVGAVAETVAVVCYIIPSI